MSNYFSNRRKTPLNDRERQMKERMMSVDNTPLEVKHARLRFIKEKLGITVAEMSILLGVPYMTLQSYLLGHRNIPLPVLKLVEKELKAFKRREYCRSFKLNGPKVKITVDDDTKTKVIALYCTGKTAEEICSELALRPEIVDHCIKLVAE